MPGGLSPSDSEKAEALADSFEATFATALDNLSHESVSRSPPHAVLPTSMELRTRGIHTEIGTLTQPSSRRPKSPQDTVGKIFEGILLTRVIREVKRRVLLHHE
jgi:hypothetical protein